MTEDYRFDEISKVRRRDSVASMLFQHCWEVCDDKLTFLESWSNIFKSHRVNKIEYDQIANSFVVDARRERPFTSIKLLDPYLEITHNALEKTKKRGLGRLRFMERISISRP